MKVYLLADCILWDRDCEDDDPIIGAPWPVARDVMDGLGIDHGYYKAVPPLLSVHDGHRLADLYAALRAEGGVPSATAA